MLTTVLSRLNLHIEYLVRHHDCVIVPGVGALMRSYSPARLSDDGINLMPAHYDYCFNALIKVNDGLLANSYARREKVSYAEATALREKDVADLNAALATDGNVTLGRLGTLELPTDGPLTFSPAESPERWFKTLMLADAPGEQTEVSVAEEKPLNRKKYYYIPVNKSMARIAAMVAIMLTLGINFLNREEQPDINNVITEYASVVPLPTVKASATDILSNEADEEVSAEKHHLVVGTFKSIEEAQLFISKRSSDSLKMILSPTLTRVSLADADTREKLLPVLRTKKVKRDYPGAWIWSE